jgi:hypothetical protein
VSFLARPQAGTSRYVRDGTLAARPPQPHEAGGHPGGRPWPGPAVRPAGSRRSLTGRGGEQVKGVRLAAGGQASGWFEAQILHTGRLPLFFFFVAFLVSFGFIRVSVRLIRAQVRWWPGNISRGDTHVHHMVFGVVFMVAGGIAGFAVPAYSLGWRAGSAALFGVGTALVLDEFALILHLRDVYWSSAGRVSIDAVFIATGVTAVLLLGITPAGVSDVANYLRLPGSASALASLLVTLVLLFAFAAITLLKGKIWTGLFGVFLPILFLVGAWRLARPHSPWARWRYQRKPAKLARAQRREQRFREPVIRAKVRFQDLVAGYRPERPIDGAPQKHERPLARDTPPGRPAARYAVARDARPICTASRRKAGRRRPFTGQHRAARLAGPVRFQQKPVQPQAGLGGEHRALTGQP